jgi:hypothetical protein
MPRLGRAAVAHAPQRAPPSQGVRAAGRHAPAPGLEIGIEHAGARGARGPSGEALGVGDLAHRPAGQAQLAADRRQRLASGMPAPDRLVDALPARPAGGACGPGRAGTGDGARAAHRGWPPAFVGQSRRSPPPGGHAGPPALDQLPNMAQAMPAVGHGRRLGSPQRGGAGVLGRAVPRAHLDPRPPAPPGRARLGGAVGQEVDDAAPLEVDQDGAVGPALPQRPVVHAPHTRRLGRRRPRHVDEAQPRVGARRQAPVRQELGAGRPAQDGADLRLGAGEPARARSTWGEELGETLGDGALRAGSMGAVEPADRWAEPNRAAEGGPIGGTAHGAAGHGAADVTASAAAGLLAGAMNDDLDGLGAEPRDVIDAAARDGAELLRTPP